MIRSVFVFHCRTVEQGWLLAPVAQHRNRVDDKNSVSQFMFDWPCSCVSVIIS